jgi:hypothetical protein
MNDIRTIARRRLTGCLSGVVKRGLMRMRSAPDDKEACFAAAMMPVLAYNT